MNKNRNKKWKKKYLSDNIVRVKSLSGTIYEIKSYNTKDVRHQLVKNDDFKDASETRISLFSTRKNRLLIDSDDLENDDELFVVVYTRPIIRFFDDSRKEDIHVVELQVPEHTDGELIGMYWVKVAHLFTSHMKHMKDVKDVKYKCYVKSDKDCLHPYDQNRTVGPFYSDSQFTSEIRFRE